MGDGENPYGIGTAKMFKMRPQSSKVRPLQALNNHMTDNIKVKNRKAAVQVADYVGPRTIEKLRTSLSSAGYSINITNGKDFGMGGQSQQKVSNRPLPQPKLRQRPASSKPPQLPPPSSKPKIDWEKEYGASIKRKTKEQKDAIFSILDEQAQFGKKSNQGSDSDEEGIFGNQDIKDDTGILQFGETSPGEQTSDEEILFE